MVVDDLAAFSPGSLTVDVSGDEARGFSWARPTSLKQPTFDVATNITYYAADRSPSYLWNSATWGISEALLLYLRSVVAGPPQGSERWRNRQMDIATAADHLDIIDAVRPHAHPGDQGQQFRPGIGRPRAHPWLGNATFSPSSRPSPV